MRIRPAPLPNLLRAAACALAVGACSSDNSPTADPPGDDEPIDEVCGQLAAELRVEDKFDQASSTFAPGEPIRLEMRITNLGNSQVELGHDGCPLVRFVVSDSGERTVFDTLPEGTACAQLLRTVELEPQQTRAFEREWSQTQTGDESLVPPGTYSVEARDRSLECRGEISAANEFTIR